MPWENFIESQFMIRFIIYAALGCVFEVIFTAFSDVLSPSFLSSWNVHSNQNITQQKPKWRAKNNPTLTGYSFVWMFPIYGLLVFMEPISFYLSSLPILLRGLIYALIIMLIEFIMGWVLEKITGRCPWDYSYSKLSIKKYTRYDFFFVWFIVSLVVEYFMPVWIELTPHIIQSFSKLYQ